MTTRLSVRFLPVLLLASLAACGNPAIPEVGQVVGDQFWKDYGPVLDKGSSFTYKLTVAFASVKPSTAPKKSPSPSPKGSPTASSKPEESAAPKYALLASTIPALEITMEVTEVNGDDVTIKSSSTSGTGEPQTKTYKRSEFATKVLLPGVTTSGASGLKVVGREDLTTKAGEYKGAAKLEASVKTGKFTLWFAPGPGLVKIVAKSDTSSQTMELTAYKK